MANQTWINEDGTRRQARALDELHAEFADKLQQLTSTLQQHDGCWGRDKLGTEFGNGYLPGARQCLTDLHTISANLSTLAADLHKIPDAFENTDKANADQLKKATEL
jgi:uncharacterized protein YukE